MDWCRKGLTGLKSTLTSSVEDGLHYEGSFGCVACSSKEPTFLFEGQQRVSVQKRVLVAPDRVSTDWFDRRDGQRNSRIRNEWVIVKIPH